MRARRLPGSVEAAFGKRLRAPFSFGDDPRAFGGPLGGFLILLGGVLDLVSLAARATDLGVRLAIDLTAIAVGVLAMFIGWRSLPRRAALVLAPIALALIAIGSIWAELEPFSFVAYFMLFYAWIGVALPRGSALLATPLATLAYVLPIVHSDAHESLLSVVVVIPIGVAIGESIAFGSTRLQRAQQRWRVINEMTSDTSFIFRFRPDGSIEEEWLTDSFSTLLGLDPAAGALDGWMDLVHPDDRKALLEGRERIRAGEEDRQEFRVLHPTEGTLWFERVARPMLDDDGRVYGYFGSARDITTRKRAEDDRRTALETALKAAEDLRSLEGMKNAFVTAASHELRTPVTSIVGIARTLEKYWNKLSIDERLDLARRLASNGERLETMFRNIIDLDRDQTVGGPGTEKVNLRALVAAAIAAVDLAEHELSVVDVDAVSVPLHRASFERILTNLLWNAARHTQPGTHLWLLLHISGGALELTIDDDGPGIADDLKKEIFEPFRQGPQMHAHAPGVGVGLSLVARFAELLGGRAWVEDRPGGGSRFRVSVPVDAPETARPVDAR